MTESFHFVEDFQTWAHQASLPLLVSALSVLLVEIASRGPQAARYVREKMADALLDLLAPKLP